MNNFRENIDLFFTESMQDCFKKLREMDENYKSTYLSHVEASKKYQEIINSLSEKDKIFMECYKDDSYLIQGVEQDWLYLQGYKDCIKFLQLIEAI